jgi:exonuclease VII small subunit
MSHRLVEKAKTELEQAQSQLDAALRAWDASVSELWRTSIALTQAQKRMTHADELLRGAVDATTSSHNKPDSCPRLSQSRRRNSRPFCILLAPDTVSDAYAPLANC